MSKALLGKRAEIEVTSLDLGDQIVAEWVPVFGITYDSKDDLLDVALDRANHLIRHPRDLVVEEAPGGFASVGDHRRRWRSAGRETQRASHVAARQGMIAERNVGPGHAGTSMYTI